MEIANSTSITKTVIPPPPPNTASDEQKTMNSSNSVLRRNCMAIVGVPPRGPVRKVRDKPNSPNLERTASRPRFPALLTF